MIEVVYSGEEHEEQDEVRSDCINWCDSFGLERWKSFSGCNSKLCAGIYCGIDNCLRSK